MGYCCEGRGYGQDRGHFDHFMQVLAEGLRYQLARRPMGASEPSATPPDARELRESPKI